MELVTPDYGLIIWSVIVFTAFILAFVALISILRNDDLSRKEVLLWTIAVFFIPFFCPFIYFKFLRGNIKHN